MWKNGKLRWAIVIVLGLVVLTMAGAGVVAFQPRTANHFGYALPGQDGLPYRVTYQGHSYINLSICAGADWCKGRNGSHSLCVTQQVLVQDNRWPLVQVGSVSTLFGASHPVMAESAANDLAQLELFVVDGNDCYVAYALQGAP
jgi:hypothetical protein